MRNQSGSMSYSDASAASMLKNMEQTGWSAGLKWPINTASPVQVRQLGHAHETNAMLGRAEETAHVRCGGVSRSDRAGTNGCEISTGRGRLLTRRPQQRRQVHPERRDQTLGALPHRQRGG